MSEVTHYLSDMEVGEAAESISLWPEVFARIFPDYAAHHHWNGKDDFSLYMQKSGRDFDVYTVSGQVFTVDIKACFFPGKTLFIELGNGAEEEIHDRIYTWATCATDLFLYFKPRDRVFYSLKGPVLRQVVPELEKKHHGRLRKTSKLNERNGVRFHTHGLSLFPHMLKNMMGDFFNEYPIKSERFVHECDELIKLYEEKRNDHSKIPSQ